MNLIFEDGKYFIHVDKYNHTLYKVSEAGKAHAVGYYTRLDLALKGLAKDLAIDDMGNYHETPDSRKYSGKAVTVEEYLITLNNRIDDVLNTDKWETLKGTIQDAVNEK